LTAADAPPAIHTVASLRNHLVDANRVEMSTIPLYLYAMYSIQTKGYSQWSPGISAFRAIRAVVIEEMLHLSLARNLLVAVGGDITYYDKSFIPKYPVNMLSRVPALPLYLGPCSQELMENVFLPLEMPAERGAPPEPGTYHTLGQFYVAIEDGFKWLDKHHHHELWGTEAEQKARRALQVTGTTYYNEDGGGEAVIVGKSPGSPEVTALETALQAIMEIIEQGEGASSDDLYVPKDPLAPKLGQDEPSHYERFALVAGNIDQIGNVWPVPNGNGAPIKVDHYPGNVRKLAEAFNAAYCYLLCIIDAMYATPLVEGGIPGNKDRRWGLEQNLLTAMTGLLYPIAQQLVSQPINDDGTKTAGPTFEYFDLGGNSKKDTLLAAIDTAASAYPSLSGDNSPRSFAASLLEV
jgi:hypothetical protein